MTREPGVSPFWRWRAVQQLVLAWLREAYRQPENLFWMYGLPILLVIVLGTAFQHRRAGQMPVDVEDGPHARATADVLRQRADLAVAIHSADECRHRLRTGRTSLVVSVRSASPPAYHYDFVAMRQESELARSAADDALQRAAGRTDAAATSARVVDEPGWRYVDFLIPGILGMTLMQSGLWGVSFLAVDLRLRKLLKRFLASPMHKTDFLAAIGLSRLVFVASEVIVILLFSRFAFGAVMYGRWLDAVLLLLLGTVTFAAIGLLIGGLARTLEAASGLTNLIMLPMSIFSGVFFPIDRFPAAARPLIELLPLTSLVSALRAVMLEGASLTAQGWEIAALALWALASFVLALRWFRWN